MPPKRKTEIPVEAQSRSAKYMHRIRLTDPERYKNHLAKEAARNKRLRSQLSEDKKSLQREKTRLRVQKLRERKRAEQQEKVRKQFKKNIKDMSHEERKEYDRVRKAESRLKMSHQKKRRIREREKQYRDNHAAKKKQFINSEAAKVELSKGIISSPISPSVRVLTSKIRKRMPKSPSKYACTIKSLIKSCSPKKKLALKSAGILSPNRNKKIEQVKNQIKTQTDHLKRKRNVENIKLMKMLKSITQQTALKIIKRSKKTVNGLLYKHKTFKVPRRKIVEFYKRGDISRPLPCKKSVKKFKVLYMMETTLLNAWTRFNEEYPNDNVSYSSFARMRPQNVKITGSKDLITCMCEYCVNILHKLDSLRRLPSSKKGSDFPKLPCTVYELNELTMCQPKSLLCAERQCNKCKDKIKNELFSQIEQCGASLPIKWVRYEKTERLVLKNVDPDKSPKQEVKIVRDYVQKSGEIKDMLEELSKELQPFGIHLFNAMWQLQQFNKLIENMEDGCLVTVEDFSENFHTKYQLTPQSSYWDMQNITLHPTVCFYRDPSTREIIREGVTLVTSDLIHDHFAAAVFRETTVNHIQKNRNFDVKRHVGWSDGCASQYKSCEAFFDYSLYPQTFHHDYEHHFFGSRHAKGPSDAEGAVIKTWVDRQIAQSGCLIQSAEDFVNLCQKIPQPQYKADKKFKTKRTIILVKKTEINNARNVVRLPVKTVKGTQKIHSVKTTNKVGTIEIRSRSCFCNLCKINQNCVTSEAGEKKIVSIIANPKSETNYEIGDWCFAIYDENLWPGIIENISYIDDTKVFAINFLTPQGDIDSNRFRYPNKKDSATLKYEDILMKSPSPPHPVTARGDFSFPKEVIDKCIEKMTV